MSPEQIVAALQARGWEAKIVNQSQMQDIQEIDDVGLLKCVDGRPSDHTGMMRGPKTLGGIYAIAALRGDTSLSRLDQIVSEVRGHGYVPSVHGDEGGSMGCGFFKLWSKRQLSGVPTPEYDSEEGRKVVTDANGKYESLAGGHTEEEVLINLVPDTTFEPTEPQRFVVDAWITSVFKLDVVNYLVTAAETVEKLGGPKVARIVVPDN